MRVRDFFKLWPAVIIGAVVGLVMVPLTDISIDSVRDSYDSRNPVVLTTGTLIRRDAEAADIAVVGDKKRSCIYVATAAYATGRDGLMRDTFVMRIDQPATNSTRPVGAQTFGVWRVWPVSGAVRLQMWATHQCEGRLVRTLLADIDLPKEPK